MWHVLMIDEQGKNLAFILSAPRSGSTLLAAILGNHEQIYSGAEFWLLLPLISMRSEHAAILSTYDHKLAKTAWDQNISEEEFIGGARQFALSVYNQKLHTSGKSLLIDKTPRYYQILPWLDKLFPHAKVIWLQRNPLDVFASTKKTWGIHFDEMIGEMPTPISFDNTLSYHFFLSYFLNKGDDKLIIKYEDIARNPEESIEHICNYLELPYHKDMLNYQTNPDMADEFMNKKLGDKNLLTQTKPNPNSIGKWVNILSPEEVQKILKTLGKNTFDNLGYLDEYNSAISFAGINNQNIPKEGNYHTIRNLYDIYVDQKLNLGSLSYSAIGRENTKLQKQLKIIKSLLILLRQGRIIKFIKSFRSYSKEIFI